jgi:hypothetical protein
MRSASRRAQDRQGKRCFFEKKQQKTFAPSARAGFTTRGPDPQKFFWFFFFKKRTTFPIHLA